VQEIARAPAEDARRLDRSRVDKKVSNREWASPSDPDKGDVGAPELPAPAAAYFT
jgi:hypothetical protein